MITCGIDEVGRGPLAGPVVACAVVLPTDLNLLPSGITDSKKLTEKKREALAPALRQICRFGLGQASVEEIDAINILQATFLAMRRALDTLLQSGPIEFALIDGNKVPPGLPCPARAIIEGDAKELAIGAASIIAKVERDSLMKKLALEHPGYGWESNAGYGSAGHMAALQQLGVTVHHRRTFAPVRKIIDLSGHCNQITPVI
jgi:ribonuclease HII